MQASWRMAFTNIHIIQAAATEATTLLKYFRSSSNGNVAEVNDLCPKDALSVETVLGLRIDDIVPRSAKIGFMKIDVEGFEVKALAGAVDTIQRNRPIVVSEFSRRSCRGFGGQRRGIPEFVCRAGI